MSEIKNVRCELVSGEDISFLEGKLKTLVDAIIIQEKQNKSAKDIVQTILWDWFNFIINHCADHLLEKKEWYIKKEGNEINAKLVIYDLPKLTEKRKAEIIEWLNNQKEAVKENEEYDNIYTARLFKSDSETE